jgi:hypothetical protein
MFCANYPLVAFNLWELRNVIIQPERCKPFIIWIELIGPLAGRYLQIEAEFRILAPDLHREQYFSYREILEKWIGSARARWIGVFTSNRWTDKESNSHMPPKLLEQYFRATDVNMHCKKGEPLRILNPRLLVRATVRRQKRSFGVVGMTTIETRLWAFWSDFGMPVPLG